MKLLLNCPLQNSEPHGSGAPAAAAPPPADLGEVVKESRVRLADAPQVGVQQKRGRGRPRKDGSPAQARDRESATAAPPDPSPAAPPIAMPSMAPMLAQGIKVPFAMRAAKTGFDGWNLSDAEAGPLGEQLDLIMKTYMPQLDQKHAVLVSFAFSLAMVTMPRMMEQVAWEKKKVTSAPPPSGRAPTTNGAHPPAPPAQPAAPPKSGQPGEVSTQSIEDALSKLH